MRFTALSLSAAAAAAAALITASVESRAAVALEKLAADGDIEPVSGLPYTIRISAGNAGKLGLEVSLSGAGVTTANDRAYLYGDAAAPRMILREGDALPGVASMTVAGADMIVGPAGQYLMSVQARNAAGYATLLGDGTTSKIVARSGDVLPGTEGYNIVVARPTYVESPTKYGLLAYLPRPSPTSDNPLLYYRTRTDGSLQLMSDTRTGMPQLAPENRSSLQRHGLHSGAYSLWPLVYAHLDAYAMSRQAVFMSRDSGHALVMRSWEPQPTIPPTSSNQPTPLWLGPDGRYVLASNFMDESNYTYGWGIYSGDEQSRVLRRMPGEVFVDLPSGVFCGWINGYDSNGAGLIVIDAMVNTVRETQVWGALGLGDADTGFRTLALSGSAAPGLDGATFASFEKPGTSNSTWQDHIDWITRTATSSSSPNSPARASPPPTTARCGTTTTTAAGRFRCWCAKGRRST